MPLNCLSLCKLDPANLSYRQMLRQAGEEVRRRQGLGQWLVPLRVLVAKTRLKAAKHKGDFRKVLQQGEVVLARTPEDIATHLDMALTGQGLNLPYLEAWLLEQACQQDPKNPEPLRRLGAVHQRQKDLDRAIAGLGGFASSCRTHRGRAEDQCPGDPGDDCPGELRW